MSLKTSIVIWSLTIAGGIFGTLEITPLFNHQSSISKTLKTLILLLLIIASYTAAAKVSETFHREKELLVTQKDVSSFALNFLKAGILTLLTLILFYIMSLLIISA
jgi:hypothetical protein